MSRAPSVVLLLLACLAPAALRAAPAPGRAPLAGAGLDVHPGARLPLELPLRRPDGTRLRVGDLLDGRPLLLTLAYYDCRMLCGSVLDGVAAAVRDAGLRPGRDVLLATVSIDPRDDAESALTRQRKALATLGASPADWPFLLGVGGSVRTLADRIGFGYRYDPRTDQYAHPAVLFAVTPDGRVSDALYGVSYPPARLTEAVQRAAHGETAQVDTNPILLRCFQYVPALRRYAGAITWFLRIGAAASLFALGGVLLRLILRERRRETLP